MRVYERELRQHLPFLRRYARALTGAIDHGDVLVTECVEVAMMAPTRFGVPGPSRAPLYALLNMLFDADCTRRPLPAAHPIEHALQRLDEIDRRLYLLVTLEDLTLVEAAHILQVPLSDASRRLAWARDMLRQELTARVLVVEDNAIVALDLSEVILSMGHIMVGTAASEREALALVEKERPTLALMDIRLGQGDNGIEVARKLKAMFGLAVIFVSAFADDLRRLHLEYLGPVVSKPFTDHEIRAAVSRVVFTPRPVALWGQS